MKKTILPIALLSCSLLSANAAVTLLNGDFSANTSNWVATAPVSWTIGVAHNTVYGEAIDSYGDGRVAAIKQNSAAYYYQQTIGTLGGQTGVQVAFDGGLRYNSVYASTARTIDLQISLWDLTNNVVLDSTTINYDYSASFTELIAESITLNYTIGANGSNGLALRFTNVSDNVSPSRDNTTIIDNVSVVAVPEPSTTALLGLGGLALIFRRRK